MKTLIATHGKFASGVMNTLSLFTELKEVDYIDAYLDDSDYTLKLKAFMESIAEDETAIIFTDLYGGSVNQTVVSMNTKSNIKIITGFNLALILEVILSNISDDEQLLVTIEQAKNEMKLMNTVNLASSNDNENLFFE